MRMTSIHTDDRPMSRDIVARVQTMSSFLGRYAKHASMNLEYAAIACLVHESFKITA